MKHKTRYHEERFFIGVELEGGVTAETLGHIGKIWESFLGEDIRLLEDVEKTNHFIGLECYPPDYMETQVFDYFALVGTKHLVSRDGFVSKKLPKGNYISFEISFDRLTDDIQKVYQYVRDHDIPVHMGFDYEDYHMDQNYGEPGAILDFTFLLEDDE